MTRPIHVVIDRTSPVPLYHQLAQQLTAVIEDGTLQPGDPFENELALAERLDLSRPTVRRAIAELVSRGLLVRRRGIGTTVANRVIHRKDELTSLFEDLQRSGRTPQTRILEYSTAAIDHEAAEALGLEPDTPLIYFERLRSADGVPMSVMHNWLPPTLDAVTEERLQTQSMYSLLREHGARPVVAKQTISARRPTAHERSLLDLNKSDPVLTMRRTAYDASGKAVEFGRHCYRSDHYAFDITVHES